jgi:N-acetylneuraminic acid mutarotase
MRSLIAIAFVVLACTGSPSEPINPSPPPPPPPAPPPPPPPPAQIEGGTWGTKASLIEPNSELPIAELNGKLWLLGGYPGTRITVRTVQIYDIATDSWQIGPILPAFNNHGMAAAVNGKIYLIGGQTAADGDPYVDTVYELDPTKGQWVQKSRMPTARSAGVALVHEGKIYVAGGRPPRGHDFAVYDPTADKWDILPMLPTQRNHMTGAVIDGRIHVVGGRLGPGLSLEKTSVHEVYDPQTQTWATAAPLPSGRSGMNGVMAKGCFHVWGGEEPAGMIPNHEYYDPKKDQWTRLRDMPIPIHGINGSAYRNDLIWVVGGGTGIGGFHASSHNQTFKPTVSCE